MPSSFTRGLITRTGTKHFFGVIQGVLALVRLHPKGAERVQDEARQDVEEEDPDPVEPEIRRVRMGLGRSATERSAHAGRSPVAEARSGYPPVPRPHHPPESLEHRLA